MTRSFEKRYESDTLYLEALHASEQAMDVARRARYLRVPEILSANPGQRVIEFEFMNDWFTLTTLIRSRNFLGFSEPRLREVFRSIGAALAEYHAGTGKIHGDFDSTNVLVHRTESRTCLIDFSRPDFDDRPDYCRGSLYRDLALFLIHLRVKYPPHQLLLAYRPQLRVLSGEFLGGYFEQSVEPYRFEMLRTEYENCLRIPYLARTFMRRFLWWIDRFDIGDLA